MKFPYLSVGSYHMPIIPVTIRNGDSCVATEALVDSGAAGSLFDAQFAQVLGVRSLKDGGEQMLFEGVSGHTLLGYRYEVTLEVGRHQFERVPIAFTAEMPDNAVNILGQRGFFELLPIAFSYGKREIEILL